MRDGSVPRHLHQQCHGCDRCNENGLTWRRHGHANRLSAQASTGHRCRLSIPTAPSGHHFIGSRPAQVRQGAGEQQTRGIDHQAKKTNLEDVKCSKKALAIGYVFPALSWRVSWIQDKERHQQALIWSRRNGDYPLRSIRPSRRRDVFRAAPRVEAT
jgi:hypothetical protein